MSAAFDGVQNLDDGTARPRLDDRSSCRDQSISQSHCYTKGYSSPPRADSLDADSTPSSNQENIKKSGSLCLSSFSHLVTLRISGLVLSFLFYVFPRNQMRLSASREKKTLKKAIHTCVSCCRTKLLAKAGSILRPFLVSNQLFETREAPSSFSSSLPKTLPPRKQSGKTT